MSSQRSHAPTRARRRRARREGHLARGSDLGTGCALLFLGVALPHLVEAPLAELVALARGLWNGAVPEPRSATVLAARAGGGLLAVTVGSAAAVGLLTDLLQTGLSIAPRRVVPDFSRLSPRRALAALVSSGRWAAPLRCVMALVLTVGIAGAALVGEADAAVVLVLRGGAGLPGAVLHLVQTLVLAGGSALLCVGGLEWVLARRGLERRLRMTTQEVRDEHRREEGDPQARSRRRSEHRRLAETGSLAPSDASVVVVNPTHVAVAVHYGPEDAVPLVGWRGRGRAAARLRRLARTSGVPIVRDIATARALFEVPSGEAIPERLFDAVAAILVVAERAGRPVP